jgi:hypothetical protein
VKHVVVPGLAHSARADVTHMCSTASPARGCYNWEVPFGRLTKTLQGDYSYSAVQSSWEIVADSVWAALGGTEAAAPGQRSATVVRRPPSAAPRGSAALADPGSAAARILDTASRGNEASIRVHPRGTKRIGRRGDAPAPKSDTAIRRDGLGGLGSRSGFGLSIVTAHSACRIESEKAAISAE